MPDASQALLDCLFSEGLKSPAALTRVVERFHELPDPQAVARYLLRRPATQPELRGLVKVTLEAKRQLGETLFNAALDESLLRAVRLGEHVICHVGPRGQIVVDDFTALLDQELEFGDFSYELGWLGHAALRSIGPPAIDAVPALLACQQAEEAGLTLAAIVHARADLLDSIFTTDSAKIELLIGLCRGLEPAAAKQRIPCLIRLGERTNCGVLKSELLSYLREAGYEIDQLAEQWRTTAADAAAAEPSSKSLLEALSVYLRRPSEDQAEQIFARPDFHLEALREALGKLSDPPWEALFERIRGYSESSFTTCLALDSQLCKAAGRSALSLLARLKTFLEKQEGDGVSRPMVFDLVAGLAHPILYPPLRRYLHDHPDYDYSSARRSALEAAGALVQAHPALQTEVVAQVETGDQLALEIFAALEAPDADAVRRIFRAKDMLDANLVVTVLSRGGPADEEVLAYLRERVASSEGYPRVLAQHALVSCTPDSASALSLLSQLLNDQDYAFGVYEGWVEDLTYQAMARGEEAAPLTPMILEHLREAHNRTLAIAFLKALGPALSGVRGEAQKLLRELRRDDPLDLEPETRQLAELLREATAGNPTA